MRLVIGHLYAMTVHDHEQAARSPRGAPVSAPYVHVRLEKLAFAKSPHLGKIKVAKVRTLDDCAVEVPATSLRTIEVAGIAKMTIRGFERKLITLEKQRHSQIESTARQISRAAKPLAHSP